MPYSYVQYTGNGSTTNYVFSFPYLEPTHIKVRVNGVITSYTFLNSSTVTISPAPAIGAIIDVRRETPKDNPPVDFTDGSVLLESDLDLLARFNLYTAQESSDGVNDSITKDTLGVWDAQSRRIKSLADPVNATDAVNKTWAETGMTSQLNIATTQASNAAASATAAAGSASTASTQAANAASSVILAGGYASSAGTQAGNAITAASGAASSATSAASSATSASGSASSASASALTATTKASEASVSATSAASSATSATNSANSAAASFDAFDDRYLGPKSAAPTLDNDGNALTSGAMYFNTSAGDMFVWNGSAWVTVSNTTSATNAANSATAAGTSATNAANSASSASTSATNAANSATAASGSASTANTAASTATTQASSATASASTASTSATNAASSATSAASSATSAATSAAAASAVALGNEPVRHSVRPSLLLDFANTKTLDPRITFTRASTATFYDGKTVAKAEENLILQSQAFTTSPWAVSAAGFTLNNVTAPDGTTTGSTLTIASASANAGAFQSTGITTAGVTLSIFAKAGTCNFVGIAPSSTAVSCYANFNLSTGAVASSAGCTASITNVGNGWYRCVLANSTLTSNGFAVFAPKTSDPAGHPWAAGTPTIGDSVLLWGAQLEQRSSVTAYTATTTAPITNYIPALQSAASGVARFEHNPITGESLGLEIEEQRTNLVLRSQEFGVSPWASANIGITENSAIAPDGTLTADRIFENTASGAHAPYNFSVATFSALPYTWSFYAKDSGRRYLYADFTDSGAGNARFDLVSGTILGSSAGVTSTITSVGNGWYRCTVTRTMAATTGGIAFYLSTDGTTITYTGDGWKGLFIWGVQIELGAFATSYIPTVASQVTRSADAASMTGTNFSSWYRADEGSVYAESFIPTNVDGAFGNYYCAISDGTISNNILMAEVDGTVGQVVVNGSVQFNQKVGSEPTAFTKMALAYKTNDFIFCVNSTLSAAGTSGRLPVVDRLFIGTRFDVGITSTNGTIKKLAYYAKKLTNAELQGLTTV